MIGQNISNSVHSSEHHLSVNVPENYKMKQFLFQKQFLSMCVCKGTIQDYEKKSFKNPELFPDF
jgi:hypothetical protein